MITQLPRFGDFRYDFFEQDGEMFGVQQFQFGGIDSRLRNCHA